jgi:hypothetical protein
MTDLQKQMLEGDGEDLMPILEALVLLAAGVKSERAIATVTYYAQYIDGGQSK